VQASLHCDDAAVFEERKNLLRLMTLEIFLIENWWSCWPVNLFEKRLFC